MEELVRLSKILAKTGKFSRHEADVLISQGRVTVDGEVAIPGTKLVVPLNGEEIVVDGVPIGENENGVYKFHKPRGYLSSYFDPNGKENLSAFPSLAGTRMGYSGRLDYDSEGLMLFTTDGDMIYRIQRSEFNVEKEYHITTDCEISEEWMQRLLNGIKDKDEQFLPCQIEHTGKNSYTVILVEGKKRQVRRMFRAAYSNVLTLKRVRIGTVLLGNVKPGELTPLTKKEIVELNRCIK